MLHLFLANLKMHLRNKQALFWNLMFPLIFTVIFGMFFGRGSATTGTVVLIQQSSSALAQEIEKAMTESDLFHLQKENEVNYAKDLLNKGKVVAVVVIPEHFGEQTPDAPIKIQVFDDPANLQANAVVLSFLEKFLTLANFHLFQVQPVFGFEEQRTTTLKLTYFDFVTVGLVGMALMNSAIMGIAITLSKYREDKILKRLMTTPLRPLDFIIAEVLAGLVINVAQVVVILVASVYLFGAHIPGNAFLLFPFVILGGILFQLLGFVIAGLTKTTRAAEGMANAIAIPMMFLSGVFFPLDQMPRYLANITQYLPLSPLLRMMRLVALEQESPFQDPLNILIVMGWIIVLLVIAGYKFRLVDE